MSAPHARWLLDQLPQWQRDGLLDAAQVAALRARYAATADAPLRPALALVILSVLGAALIGLGVILLLAHNWDSWSRATRTVVSLAPLALTQALSLWVLLRRGESTAWRESAATAQALALAAAIALIGQTYHLYGNLDDYLLSCALLVLPLAYVLRSVVIGAGYALVIGIWAWQTSSWLWLPLERGTEIYPALLAMLAPALLRELRAGRDSPRSAILLGSVALSLALALPAVLGLREWPGAYAALFACCVLADARWFAGREALFGRPLRACGALGTVVLALAFSSREGWRALENGLLPAGEPLQVLLPLILIVGAAVLWAMAWREREPGVLAFGALPWLAALAPQMGHAPALVVFNLYTALLATLAMRQGFRTQRLRTLNFGLAIAAALILLRFVDSELSFTVRGIGFVVVGAAVLGANLVLLRRRRSAS